MPFAGALLLIFASSASATNSIGFELCVGPYAPCASAQCTALPDNASFATCHCQGPFYDEVNLGHSTCRARAQRLRSTFSLRQQFTSPIQPALYDFVCEGDNASAWVNCLDAPCSLETGSVVCTCPIQPAGSNLYVGTACPRSQTEKKKMCSRLRATQSTEYFTAGLAEAAYGLYADPPSLQSCDS